MNPATPDSEAVVRLGTKIQKANESVAAHHPQPTNDSEHYVRPGSGTQTACSCGKSFGLALDALKHIEWQLKIQALIAADRIKFIETLESEMPKKRAMGGIEQRRQNGKFNLAIDQMTAILRRHKEGTK